MRFKQFNEEADKLEMQIASIMHNSPSVNYNTARKMAIDLLNKKKEKHNESSK